MKAKDMAGNKDFQERLKRMGHDSEAPARTFAPAPQPRRSSGISGSAIVVAFMVMGALYAGYLTLQYLNRENPMTQLASAYLRDVEPPPVSEMTGLFAPTSTDNAYQRSCLPFLPSAPEGWVRVTTWDTRYPELVPRLNAIWQTAGTPLQDAAGYEVLSDFVALYSGPHALKPTILGQRTTSSAVYLNPDEDLYFLLDIKTMSWREASTCREEFLYHWADFDPAEPAGWPLLKQFSMGTIQMSQERTKTFVRVSPGLEIETYGNAESFQIRDVLDGDDIPQRVATVMASLQK